MQDATELALAGDHKAAKRIRAEGSAAIGGAVGAGLVAEEAGGGING